MLLPFQILAVVGSAMFAGVMLAIGLILGAFWQSLPPSEFLAWFQAHSHLVMRAIPVVVLPTLLGLAGSVWLSFGHAAARNWWLASLACILAVLALTLAYFFPINASFAAGDITLDEVPGRLAAWLSVHNVRIALGIAAAVCGLVAVTR